MMNSLRVLTLAIGLMGIANLTAAQSGPLSEFQEQAAVFAQECAKCHTLGEGDRVGPDLKGVSERRDREWLAGFIGQPSLYLDTDPLAQELLRQYADVRMPDLGLSQNQAEGVIDYIDAFSEASLGAVAETSIVRERIRDRVSGPQGSTGVWIPGLLGGLVLLIAVVVISVLTRNFRFGRIAQVSTVVFLALAYWSLGGRESHHLLGNDQGYEPEQPINFSHALHAGDMDISCLYCHHNADKGPVAGIPSASTCMNCHSVVEKRTGQTEPSPEIKKLLESWKSGKTAKPQPVEWTRVHNLPDFVRFNHQVHVTNDITCQECHGAVQKMERVKQVSDLSMGWCISCHRMEGPEASTHWARSGGPQDCAACHW